jgi:hypothetical protein
MPSAASPIGSPSISAVFAGQQGGQNARVRVHAGGAVGDRDADWLPDRGTEPPWRAVWLQGGVPTVRDGLAVIFLPCPPADGVPPGQANPVRTPAARSSGPAIPAFFCCVAALVSAGLNRAQSFN